MQFCALLSAEFKHARVWAQQDDMLNSLPIYVKNVTFYSMFVRVITIVAVDLGAVIGKIL